MNIQPTDWFYVVAGAILVAISLVAAVLRRNGPTLAFASFSLGLGLAYIVQPMLSRGVLPIAVFAVGLTFLSVGAWGLFAFFPRPLRRTDFGMAILAATIAFGYRVLSILGELRADPAYFSHTEYTTGGVATALRVANNIVNTGVFAALILFALRTRHLAADDTGAARSLAYISTGIFLFGVVAAPTVRLAARGDLPISDALLDAIGIMLFVLTWALATRGHHGRIARNVVIAGVVIALWYLAFTGPIVDYAFPVTRFLGALVLGYAVMRGQIEGLDVKVRFALSKSTIAAVFIAVFFIVSELAQQFFGEQFGGPYVGILAAGGLVFAIAPLSRLADRIAFKAIPTTPAEPAPTTEPVGADGLEDYRAAVRLALRDRHLSRTEERALLRLAERAGISASRALAIHEEVEKEGFA